MSVSITQQIKAVEREISMRRRVYPKQVRRGRMSLKEAQDEIEAMQAVKHSLEHYKQLTETGPSLFNP